MTLAKVRDALCEKAACDTVLLWLDNESAEPQGRAGGGKHAAAFTMPVLSRSRARAMHELPGGGWSMADIVCLRSAAEAPSAQEPVDGLYVLRRWWAKDVRLLWRKWLGHALANDGWRVTVGRDRDGVMEQDPGSSGTDQRAL